MWYYDLGEKAPSSLRREVHYDRDIKKDDVDAVRQICRNLPVLNGGRNDSVRNRS